MSTLTQRARAAKAEADELFAEHVAAHVREVLEDPDFPVSQVKASAYLGMAWFEIDGHKFQVEREQDTLILAVGPPLKRQVIGSLAELGYHLNGMNK